MTPPLVLRSDGGERVIVEVDDQLVTGESFASSRLTVLLTLAPGLRIQVGSRSINKRRFPHLRISPEASPSRGESFYFPAETIDAGEPKTPFEAYLAKRSK